MGSDEGLARVTEFRKAARVILRDGLLDDGARAEALVRLTRRGWVDRDESTMRAVLAELLWDIDQGDVNDRRNTGEILERRHRRLRSIGYANCPECWTPLTTEVDWARWRRLREDAIREAEAREGAVPDDG